MSGTRTQRSRAPRATLTGVWAATVALVVGLLAPVAATPAAAAQPVSVDTGITAMADLSQFQPGNIISDAVFFYKDSMTEAQIQAFLEQKVPRCEQGYTCLRDWYDTSRTTTADAMCGAYSGGVRERASRIIYKVAQACGINPQVILVTLQKEQGLVNHVWPSDWRYTIAMGQGCPDTAACDTRYYGFFNQVYGAAWQLKRYANPPGTSAYFTWYAPGRTWDILYNPNRGCGSSPVYVQNQATANLYYYTPYQPNAAALRAGYAEGDGCSSYGNRNFYNYFTDWFGSTQVPANACAQPAASAVTPAGGEFLVNTGALNARSAPSTSCEPVARSLTQGTAVTRLGTHGEWVKIRLDGRIYWVHGAYLTPAPAVAWTTDRIAGADRYETAVAVSKATSPNGAPVVFLASGQDFPDALSAAAAAAKSGGSLLLTPANGLPATVSAELQRLAPTRVVLVGGDGALSAAVADQVASLLPNAQLERIGGADRYETSRLLAQGIFGTAATAYLATGADFADALAASAVAGAGGFPVVLVDGTATVADDPTIAALRALKTTSAKIAGGAAVVSQGIATSLTTAGIAVTRYGGSDRYQTSLLMNSAAYGGQVATAFLATGVDFPDSLSGAVLAGRTKQPLLSQPATCMTGATKDWLGARGVTRVRLIGGAGAMQDDVARSVRC